MREPGEGAQLPRAARRAGLILAAVALGAAGTAVADRTVSKRAQLDDDPSRERVDRRFVDCPKGSNAPRSREQCGYIAVVDGEVTYPLTRTTQPRTRYGWYPREPVRLRDLTGDGRPELVWDLMTSGATGSSPRLFGVHRWAGGRPERIFARNVRRLRRRGRHAIPVRLTILPVRRGLRELRLCDLIYRRGDGTCCPSFVRTQRFRWNGDRMAFVGGSTRVRRT